MEKDITFKVPIKKVNDDGKLTTYKLKTTDSYRFMNESLSTLANNLSEINIGKCQKILKIKIYILNVKIMY